MASKISQSERIIHFLQHNPLKRFTARELALGIISAYPEEYEAKRNNPRFADDNDFISQVVAEIGRLKPIILKKSQNVFTRDRPRPRVFWFDPDNLNDEEHSSDELELEEETSEVVTSDSYTEHDLYPILMEYLKSEQKLLSYRIDEKRSKNSMGSGGNQWLHPDVVAMQTIDKEWHDLVRSCAKHGGGETVRLWSFEVKKALSRSNVRKSFFQAVSNSSWANEGYLVAADIDDKVQEELRMLSALHGIGVILLNPSNPTESEMYFSANPRKEVDWTSVNRIVEENEDFKDFIDLVSAYFQTGRVRAKDWNKV